MTWAAPLISSNTSIWRMHGVHTGGGAGARARTSVPVAAAPQGRSLLQTLCMADFACLPVRPVPPAHRPTLYGRRHTGRSPFSMVVGPKTQQGDLQPVWTYPTHTHGIVAGTPVIGFDGTVYACSDNGALHAINGSTGVLRWVHQATGYVLALQARAWSSLRSSASWVGLAVFGVAGVRSRLDAAHSLLAYACRFAFGSPAVTSASVDQVYYATDEGFVRAVKASTGELVWSYEIGTGDCAS